MSEQEIIEGNKLIAEFAGATKGFSAKEGEFYYLPNEIPTYLPGELKYHNSFDWLMPIVESIIKSGWQFQLNSYGVSNDAKFINGENHVQNVAWSTPLLATYNVVVDFIKWHNSQGVSAK